MLEFNADITMKKRIFIGVVLGIILVVILRGVISGNVMYYLSILVGSFFSAFISRRIISGFILSIIIVISEAGGFYLSTGEIASLITVKYLRILLPIYLMELILGIIGGWLGAVVSRKTEGTEKGTG